MATFKVGDKVRIKASCKVGNDYDHITLLDSMTFNGIRTINEDLGDGVFTLKEDAVQFAYSEEMLETAKVTKYKVGDRVKVRADLNYDTKYFMDDKEPGNYFYAVADMVTEAGKVVAIESARSGAYMVLGSTWSWTDEMFEGLVEEEPIPIPVPAPKKPMPKKPNGKFNIGDRVRCTYNQDGADVKDKVGTIIGDISKNGWYPIKFDEPVTRKGKLVGHDCDRKCKRPYGWKVKAEYLELAIFEEFKEAVDLTFNNPLTGLTHLVNPPVLTSIERTKCVIASSTYPYAVMETDGLFFYADVPIGYTYFETKRVMED